MADLSGKPLGQYQLIKPINSGGMATIYTANQPSLDRIVAIKILPDYLIDQPGFLERFATEAHAIAKLDHPHILPIYDYGQADRIPYLVMKHVTGGTLKDLMTGPMDLHQTSVILRQIAEALDFAHKQGIIHRDIKPSNVLMQDSQWVLLADFGLAKIMGDPSQITASGVGVGTPDYMSPEQASGEAVDARSDVYSLGVMLYQMLTGKVPFQADTPLAVMLKHITEPPPSASKSNPKISAEIDHVVQRALAKSPHDRYSNAIELADAFDYALDLNATLPVQSLASAPRPIGQLWPIGVGAIIVVAIAIVLIGNRNQSAAVIPEVSATPQATATIVPTIALPTSAPTSPPITPNTSQLGDQLFDDFSEDLIDTTRWSYDGAYTATLNSPAVNLQNGRLAVNAENAADEYLDGELIGQIDNRAFTLVAARVTLLNATGFSDIGLQVNGIDDRPDSWAYLAMNPTDGTTSAYIGSDTGTEQTYALEIGKGMPAAHELAIGFKDGQLTFYVDGSPRKSVAALHQGESFWLLFDVEPKSDKNGIISGSFDDVRITYAK